MLATAAPARMGWAPARALAGWGPSVVVVKKGEDGCLLWAKGAAYPLPAFPVPCLQDRREIEMADTEVAEVRDEPTRVGEGQRRT